MTDYDELVKALREKSKRLSYDGWIDTYIFLEQAADAIEELQQIAEHYKGCADEWYNEACDYKAMVPRWISVEERLPEKKEQIADHWFSAEVIGKDEVTIRKAYYNFTADVWLDANCEMEWDSITHWMPMPPKEETE